MSEFSIGEVVQLKSGGPLMTVSNIDSNRMHVLYFNPITGEFETAMFFNSLLNTVIIQPTRPSQPS